MRVGNQSTNSICLQQVMILVDVKGSHSSSVPCFSFSSDLGSNAPSASFSTSSSDLYHHFLFHSSSVGHSCSDLGFPCSSYHKKKDIFFTTDVHLYLWSFMTKNSRGVDIKYFLLSDCEGSNEGRIRVLNTTSQ